MNHSDVRSHLADYLEGDLELGKRALFDAHLDECGDCARELAEMQGTIALLRSLPEPEVPTDLAANVMRRIRSGEGRRTWVEDLRSLLAWATSPPILYPASLAMIFAGVLMATGRLQLTLPLDSIVFEGIRVVRGVPEPSPRPGGRVPTVASATERDSARRLVAVGQPVDRASATRPPFAAQGSESTDAAPLLRERTADGQYLLSSRLRMRTPGAGDAYAPQLPPPWIDSGRTTSAGFAQVSRVEVPRADADATVPSTEEWLDLLQHNPASFARKLSRLTLAEQELWVENLARQAVERGLLDEIIAALRASSSERARGLAENFVAAGAAAESAVVADTLRAGYEGSSPAR